MPIVHQLYQVIQSDMEFEFDQFKICLSKKCRKTTKEMKEVLSTELTKLNKSCKIRDE